MLFITATLRPGYWLYSITQPSGGPHRTLIELEESAAFCLQGQFAAIQQPVRERIEVPDWPVLEKHSGCVTWRAVIELAPGVDRNKVTIKGAVKAQVDTEAFCLVPTDYPFTAVLAQLSVYRQAKHRFASRVCATKSRQFCGRLWRVVHGLSEK